jgi:uncharacterized protein
LNKPGIRVLGIAESVRPGRSHSVLAGVVMRRDLVVDGFVLGRATLEGDDATRAIAAMVKNTRRNDVNLLLVSGAILSRYNIVDVDSLARLSRLPVICLTYRESSGIEGAIERHFPNRAGPKVEAYHRLGPRKPLKLASGRTVFVRTSGLSEGEAARVLDAFTLQGSIPEPVRVARLLAREAGRVRGP